MVAETDVSIPNDITEILSESGLPAGAIALAVGLVRGAGALERDASEPALKYVSGLLINGTLTSLGKLGGTLIPAILIIIGAVVIKAVRWSGA